MDGILPLWKPAGMTSHDCVMKIKRLYQTKRVGHTGTLDPDAEGVLVLCIGKATKIVSYMVDTPKTYQATVALGTSTETEDATGSIVNQRTVTQMPSKDEIQSVLNAFTGDIVQIPPMYSAVRVDGKHLYEYARANETVERPKRHVNIQSLALTSDVDHWDQTFKIQIVCSKGTYIRTLCVDIGKHLGYPAHMAHLVRLETGGISANDTYTFQEVNDAVEEGRHHCLLINMAKGIGDMDRLEVDQDMRRRVLQGQKFSTPNQVLTSDPFAVMCGKEFLAIYEHHPKKDGEIKPVRVFH